MIYKTAINKPITTALIFVAVVILGIFSYKKLPIDQLPEMDPPYVTVPWKDNERLRLLSL